VLRSVSEDRDAAAMSLYFDFLRDVVFRPIEFHRREIRNIEENKAKAEVDLEFAYVSELREEIVRLRGAPRRVRRVFITAHGAPAYEGIGWILADDMDQCMVCNHAFGMFFDPQVHCHACGSIVCSKCQHPAVVHEIRKVGFVPVCSYCDWGQVMPRLSAHSLETLVTEIGMFRTGHHSHTSIPRGYPQGRPCADAVA
jgi:hypothetical protein